MHHASLVTCLLLSPAQTVIAHDILVCIQKHQLLYTDRCSFKQEKKSLKTASKFTQICFKQVDFTPSGFSLTLLSHFTYSDASNVFMYSHNSYSMQRSSCKSKNLQQHTLQISFFSNTGRRKLIHPQAQITCTSQ